MLNIMDSNASAGNQPVAPEVDLTVSLGRLTLPNPIMVASGTFGYAREMEKIVQLSKLGAVLPKTITHHPRPGNAPWRTLETNSGLLNAIGLDNDGVEYFLVNHWPYLAKLSTKVIVSIAGKSFEDFVYLAERMNEAEGLEAIELNVSCPNVSGGVDFGTDPKSCYRVVNSVRNVTNKAIFTKLTPNVTSIAEIAKAAAEAGTDAVSCINTVLGMAVDWRKQKPILGNRVGGLSGPAIKPIALRCVYQVASAVDIPIIGIGGIATIDDVMEFIVTGASAIQIGTANYYDPTVSTRLIDELPAAIHALGFNSVRQAVKSLK
jgi:dihydroorotate dehydrogenase (NAD+) catalytic subunit